MKSFTRRQFLASTSALVVASQLPGNAQPTAEKTGLAVNGGAKAVKKAPKKLVRWGEPERLQVDQAIAQDTLFYWKGPQTRLLTERFQKTYPYKHVMPCSSGTAALHIAVAAAGIGPGDEVITAPITDMGTVTGILFQQAVPVFADLEPHTYNLDPADVVKRITPKTKAIIVVHLGGNPARMKELKAIADEHKLVLIEDCAQAWGAKYQGQPIGLIGHIGCFSLQNSKHITCGDGGIVASSDPKFGPLLQPFGDKGGDRLNAKAGTEVLGTNYRMNELSAAFAAAQLLRLEDVVSQREKLGSLLTKELAGVSGVTLHEVAAADRCTYWFYMARIEPKKLTCDLGTFVKALSAEGVSCGAGYIATTIYGTPVFQKHAFFAGRWPLKETGLTTMDYTKVKCPEAEAILETCFRLVIHEAMDEEYIRGAAAAIRKVTEHYRA